MALVLRETSECQLVNHDTPKKEFSFLEIILHEFG
jgi:hypothetical protein